MKSWYSIKNVTENAVDISLHEEIGLWGVTAADFIADLNNHKGVSDINLSIHSPGGSVLDGFAMYNALKYHPAKVHGTVEGIAASAASFVLMAADTISMPEDAFIMIHNAWGGAMGDADELRSAADVIDKLQDSIVNIYEKRTGLKESELRDMMRDETWLNAQDAIDKGFIDTITNALGVAAKTNIFNKHFKSMPISNDSAIDELETIKDFERHLREVCGLSKGLALALTSRARAIFQGDPDEKPSSNGEILAALERFKIPS